MNLKMPKSLTNKRPTGPRIGLTLQAWKEGKAYVAYTPELDVSSCGNTLSQAKARLREAVPLFLEEAYRLGTLEDILSEGGFERRGDLYQPHKVVVREKLRLAVPVAS